jgi:hypothetical protein
VSLCKGRLVPLRFAGTWPGAFKVVILTLSGSSLEKVPNAMTDEISTIPLTFSNDFGISDRIARFEQWNSLLPFLMPSI